MAERFERTDAAYVAGRFGGSQSLRYRAPGVPDGPLRKTAAEARQDEKDWLEKNDG